MKGREGEVKRRYSILQVLAKNREEGRELRVKEVLEIKGGGGGGVEMISNITT